MVVVVVGLVVDVEVLVVVGERISQGPISISSNATETGIVSC